MLYNTTTNEITRSTATSIAAKTFVIDHPIDGNKYLVHACLEGPEAGVYYRGEGEITNGHSVSIELPNYVSKIATNFTVQITPLYEGDGDDNIIESSLYSTRVKNNMFKVYTSNKISKSIKFFWHVYGTRQKVDVEPLRNKNIVRGEGPYKWISNVI